CHHPPTTEIYTLSLHDALPISGRRAHHQLRHHTKDHRRGDRDPRSLETGETRDAVLEVVPGKGEMPGLLGDVDAHDALKQRVARSEEHTSELQSLRHLVCRLLL